MYVSEESVCSAARLDRNPARGNSGTAKLPTTRTKAIDDSSGNTSRLLSSSSSRVQATARSQLLWNRANTVVLPQGPGRRIAYYASALRIARAAAFVRACEIR